MHGTFTSYAKSIVARAEHHLWDKAQCGVQPGNTKRVPRYFNPQS